MRVGLAERGRRGGAAKRTDGKAAGQNGTTLGFEAKLWQAAEPYPALLEESPGDGAQRSTQFEGTDLMTDPNLSSFIWSVADLLRGDYKQSEYGKVILPFTVLRRLDCVLEPTKPAVLAEKALREKAGLNPEPFLLKKSGQLFYNTSPLDLKKLMGDQDHIGENLRAYVQGFSPAGARHLRALRLPHADRPARQGRPALPGHREVREHRPAPRRRSATRRWALVFEELIRKFAELSNETAGEHFTPREVIRLMVNLLFIEDDDALTKPGVVRSHLRPDRRHRRHADRRRRAPRRA